jgi:cytochrome c-type biogenesis protein CcmH
VSYVLIILAVLIATVGMWFLVRPLARGTHVGSREDFFQLQTVRDRLLAQLNELDLEERDHNMDAGTAADERVRLEAELADVLKKLEALAPEATSVKQEHGRSKKLWRWVVVALALAVPSVAAGLFFMNVTVPLTQLEQVAATPAAPDPLQMVARLEQRMQQNPGDVQGWLRLGRSYAVLGRLDDARMAYEHAYALLPKDYEPDSAEGFWFLGLAAYNRGENQQAIALWKKLLAALPPESEAAQQLRQVIIEAEKKPSVKKPPDQKSRR